MCARMRLLLPEKIGVLDAADLQGLLSCISTAPNPVPLASASITKGLEKLGSAKTGHDVMMTLGGQLPALGQTRVGSTRQ